MRFSYKALAALCSIAISVNSGCSEQQNKQNGESSSTVKSGSEAAPLTTGAATEEEAPITYDIVSQQELAPTVEGTGSISFSDNKAECKGSGVSAVNTVATITKAGGYVISGSCSNGQLVIDCGKKDEVYLILDGVTLACENGPAVLCENASKLTITVKEGSQNSLSDGKGYTEELAADTGAAIFSKDDLIINGTGSLNVTGAYKDGIKCKDGLKLCGGNVTVTAAEDGIIGRDYVLAAAGNYTINSGFDGIKSTNDTDSEKGYICISGGSFDITSGNDAFQAETDIEITDGTLKLLTGGGSAAVEHTAPADGGYGRGQHGGFFTDGSQGFDFGNMENSQGEKTESMKGLKAGGTLSVSGGKITADCADDAVHSNKNISISGGSLTLATGDDGLHADALITISGGDVTISDCYEGVEAPGIEINGGTVSINAFDDGFNASGNNPYITIIGGNITVNADGDGVDSNGTISMSGGTLVVFGPTNGGNGALDYEKSFALSGGTLIALGSRQMAQAPSTLSQPCISIYSSVTADSALEVRDSEDNVIISAITPKVCESLIFSSPELEIGKTYSIYAEEQLISTVTAAETVSGGGASGDAGGFNKNDWGQGGSRPDGTDFFGSRPDRGGRPDDFNPGDMPAPPDSSGTAA